jgi:hypothetical protein
MASWPNVTAELCARAAAVTGIEVPVAAPLTVSTSVFSPVSYSKVMPLVKLAPPDATPIAVPPAARIALDVPVGATADSV